MDHDDEEPGPRPFDRNSSDILRSRNLRRSSLFKRKYKYHSIPENSSPANDIFTGKIAFPRPFPYETRVVPFMRLIPNVNIKDVLHILERQWNIFSPRIVLFVVSNISSIKNWKADNFAKGLVMAANTTDMWICTNGMNIGVVKAIGDAFEREASKQQANCSKHASVKALPEFVLLGLCQEERLSNAEKLCEKAPVIEFDVENASPIEETKYDLNPSHTHFIITKRSKRKKSNATNDFISHLVYHLAEALESEVPVADPSKNEDILELVVSEIPIVAILIQGGASCVQFILAHLKKSLPVIIIKGSGGLADLLSHAYYEINRRPLGIDDAEYVENVLKPELSSKISQEFESLCYNNLQRLSFCDKILECLMYSKQGELEYLTVLHPNDTSSKLDDLPSYILHALIKSQKPDTLNWEFQLEKVLYLAMDWNRPDMAVREVFYKDPSSTFKIANSVFETALLNPGREFFVSLYLRHGFQVHKYLNSITLVRLFRHSLKEQFFHLVCWQGVLGYGLATRLTTDFLDCELNWLIEEITGIPGFMNSQELDLNAFGMYAIDKDDQEDADIAAAERKARTILTIWAILSNRIVLAKQLWRHSDYPIHLALIISMILRKLQFFVNEMGEKEEIEKQSREFGKMATKVFDACYKEIPCRAYDLLCDENPDFSFRTVVDIAAVAENKIFIAHPCCQKWVDKMFMGNVRIRDLTWGDITFPTWLKVILCALFVFPMFLWVRFKDPEESMEYFRSKDDDNEVDDHEITIRNFSLLRPNKKKLFTPRRIRKSLGSEQKMKLKCISIFKKIFWMWSAPITKFWIFQVTYILYLLLFSLAVIWPSCGNKMLDIIVCSWTTMMIIESTHRTYVLHKKFYSMPLLAKCLETFLLFIFISLYALGRISGYGAFFDPYSSKILLCCFLLYFYYRVIFIALPISPSLGPQLHKIKHMVFKDFVNFMRLALLVMISSAIVLQALIYPDFPLSEEMFRRIFNRAWISLFLTPAGDFGESHPHCVRWIRRPKNASICLAGRYLDKKCPNPGLWPYIFGIQYFMLLKVVLISLLYALFTNSQRIMDDSDVIWKFQRYQLVVDFAHRQRLPAPLNILSYLCMALGYIFRLCYRSRKPTVFRKQLSLTQYNYWRQLAYKFGKDQESRDKEEDILRKQHEQLLKLAENVTLQHKMIYGLKSHLTELQFNVSSTHSYLDSFKLDKVSDMEASARNVQCLSRRSPYPNTKVNRLPVTDKYVSWDIPWLFYDPIAFTLPKADFITSIRPFVDEDIHAVREIQGDEFTVPVFGWNLASYSPAGVYLNRQSWMSDGEGNILTYEIDSENLPRNPMGRTGLRGRGALPRWGPNHHVFLIITRWNKTCMGSTANQLELVVTQFIRIKELSVPGGLVFLENHYAVLQHYFKTDGVDGVWKDSQEMIEFFRSHAIYPDESSTNNVSSTGMKSQLLFIGYMDSPLNTDQAWVEAELWHFHYNAKENLQDDFKDNGEWCLATEDMFNKLLPGLVPFVRGVTRSLNAIVI